jgi:hypothetical protein
MVGRAANKTAVATANMPADFCRLIAPDHPAFRRGQLHIKEQKIMTTLTILSAQIRQLDGLYSLNDLHKASGGEEKHRPNQFIRLDQTQELIAEISNCADLRNYIPIKSGRGKFGGTYVCRELVYAYAMWISAKFHLLVIRAFDALYGQQSKPEPQLLGNSEQFITPTQIEELKDFHEQLIRSLPKLTINPPVWTKPDPAGTKDTIRNIQTMRSIITELQTWCHELPAEAGLPLWEALDDLKRLLITGSTEVSEALTHLAISARYLKRWIGQGR